jgi:Zn-dependent protease with chaperone function
MTPSSLYTSRPDFDGPMPVRTQLRKLRAVRLLGWLVFLAEILILAACWRFLLMHHRAWLTYVWSLAAVLAWFHGLPLCLSRWLTKAVHRVEPTGDHWLIGRYSEAELRQIVEQATANLPQWARRLNVCIVDVRAAAAWTWLSIFRPHAVGKKPIILTSGSLHYLRRDELIAVLLHEIGHHLPRHRMAVCGGWPLADATYHALAFLAYCQTGSGALAVWLFVILRWIGIVVAAGMAGKLARSIEHLCDLFSAEHVGSLHMINALLKLAEDDELSEVVLVWAAREMIHDNDVALDDLVLALADARPYGRIFHEDLIHHAAEISRILGAQRKRPRKTGGKENQELKEFVEKRRGQRVRRIRWRRFDGDGDGVLTAEEVVQLCETLVTRPDHVLVTSRDEIEPTSHPRCRDRILLLQQAHPVCHRTGQDDELVAGSSSPG